MSIARHDISGHLSKVVEHNGTVYVAGTTAEDKSVGMKQQTERQRRHEQVEAAGRDRLYFGHGAKGGDERSVARLDRPQQSSNARLRRGGTRQ